MGTAATPRSTPRLLTVALAVLALVGAQLVAVLAPAASAATGTEDPEPPLDEPEPAPDDPEPDDPEPDDPEPDDPEHEPAISIDKSATGGVEFDDDGAPYVVVTGGATHDILYEFAITNTGTEALTDLTLTDDRIGDLTADLDAEVTDGILQVDETVTVTAVHGDVGVDTFEVGLLVNVGVVTATGVESGERVSAEDEESVFDVEVLGDQTSAPVEEAPAPGSASDRDAPDDDDGEVEVLAEVRTDPDAEDDELPRTGSADLRLTLLGLLLTVLGLTALTLPHRSGRPCAPQA